MQREQQHFLDLKHWTPDLLDLARSMGNVLDVPEAELSARLDDIDRVLATQVAQYRRDMWATHYHLKRAGSHHCIWRLLDKRCDFTRANRWYQQGAEGPRDCELKGSDHTSLWLRAGKPVAYVTQPYHISQESLRGMLTFCQAHDLDLEIRTWPSWHFPGHVLTLVITRNDRPLRP